MGRRKQDNICQKIDPNLNAEQFTKMQETDN